MPEITENHAILSDIDLSLLPPTSTDIELCQQELMLSLEKKLSGAVAMITGRGIESVDKVFPGVAASVEQHAAWRSARGEELSVLGAQMDVNEIVAEAIKELTGKVRLVEDIAGLPYVENGVFVEQKQFSLALVFSYVVDEETKEITEKAARKILAAKENLKDTHSIKIGSDSVEIGPSGIDKGTAVRDFMSAATFKGRIPIYIGDGPTDEAAMEVVKEMGGFNVAVGDLIKDESLVDIRVDTIEEAWDLLKSWDAKLAPS